MLNIEDLLHQCLPHLRYGQLYLVILSCPHIQHFHPNSIHHWLVIPPFHFSLWRISPRRPIRVLASGRLIHCRLPPPLEGFHWPQIQASCFLQLLPLVQAPPRHHLYHRPSRSLALIKFTIQLSHSESDRSAEHLQQLLVNGGRGGEYEPTLRQ